MNLSYQDTYKSQQKKALLSLKVKANEEAVSAVEAWALASSLTNEDDVVRVWWRKMVGAPAQAVRRLSREIRASRPEMHEHVLSEFRKKYPANERKAS